MSGLLTDGSNGNSSSVDTTTTVVAKTTTTIATGELRTYVVQSGESLFSIAQRFNLSAPALVEINGIKNPDRVPAGTLLKLPPSNGFVAIGATTTMPP